MRATVFYLQLFKGRAILYMSECIRCQTPETESSGTLGNLQYIIEVILLVFIKGHAILQESLCMHCHSSMGIEVNTIFLDTNS